MLAEFLFAFGPVSWTWRRPARGLDNGSHAEHAARQVTRREICMPTALEVEFHTAMEAIYTRAKEEAGYNATAFRESLI